MTQLHYPQWLDYLEHFLEVDPDPEPKELFKRFPELMNDERILDAAYAHILAIKTDGVTPSWLKSKFPEIYRPRRRRWWHKIKIWTKSKT